MTLHVLVPCKSLRAGKSRLAPLLDPEARRALCTTFLRRTLDLALMLAPPSRCHVISADPEALALAAARGASTFGDPGRGLNEALRLACEALGAGAQGGFSPLILPIDLPYADAAALRAMTGRRADVVIAPDRARTGTNALFLRSPAALEFGFRFGPDSFAAHRGAAIAAGLDVDVFEDAGLAFDVDRPEDYAEWQRGDMQGRVIGDATMRS